MKAKFIKMSLEEFIKEHRKLIQLLESGSEEERQAEAVKQQKELDSKLKQAH